MPWSELTVLFLVGILAYAWVGFPALLRWAAGRRSVPPAADAPATTAALPPVTVIISAYNEEPVIGDRVRNLLALDYPSDRLRGIIGVDGATDRTAEVAKAAAGSDSRIEVVAFAANRGKVAVLKDLVGRARDSVQSSVSGIQILVFSDANTLFGPNALRQLVAPFTDPSVGGVCGRLEFVEKTGDCRLQTADLRPHTLDPGPSALASEHSTLNTDLSSPPEGLYWRWETKLKMWESRLDSCLGANGAIYAIRAPLFASGIPDNTIVDDFVIGMKVREAGPRMVYEPSAVAREELPERREEWRRRVRIGAGDYQALWLCRRCLRPRYGWFAWSFWSHKALRWFTPHLMLALVACSIWCSVFSVPPSPRLWRTSQCSVFGQSHGQALLEEDLPFCRTEMNRLLCPSFLCLLGAFGVAFLALVGRLCGRRFGLGLAAWHFVEMQAALFVGFLRFCRGNLRGRWDRTPRGRP